MSLERYLQDIADESKPLRYTCIGALSDLGKAEVDQFAQVWARLSTSRRRQLVERMVEMAETNVELDFKAILAICLKDPDEVVREKAISGLWESEDRSVMDTLVHLLKTDPSEKVRAASAGGLRKFAIMAQEGKLPAQEGERLKEALLSVARNRQEVVEVKRRSLEAVAPFNTLAVQELIRQAYNSTDLNLKASAIYAMGQTGEPQWLPLLAREMKSPSPVLRYEAVNACAELGQEEMVPHVIPLLNDDDLQVQLAAVRCLGALGGPLAVKALKRCIRSAEPAIQEAAQEALENIEALEDPLSFKYTY